jgi:hypothetical protein
MFLLNRSFHFIVQRLEELGKTNIINARDLKDALGLTQEVQLGINTAVLDTLDSIENDDWAQFGKVRIALEKRLKTPLPERRRKRYKANKAHPARGATERSRGGVAP